MQHGQIPASPAEIRQSMLRELTDTNLSEGSRELLRNLVQKDMVLAFLKEPEVKEWKWKLRTKQELFFVMHPGADCLVTGEDRAAINGNVSDRLSPLSQEQKIVVRDFFDMLELRISRARDMKQQEMMNTQIREARSDRDESGGGGLKQRLRGN